jgi:hypothetical protein
MRALGRTSAQFRRARGYSDEGAGLRPLAFQRFIGADTAGKIALGSRSRQPVPLASAPCGAAGRAGVHARVSARSQRAAVRASRVERALRTHRPRCTRAAQGARTAVTAARAEGVRCARRRLRTGTALRGIVPLAHGGSGEARPVSRGRAECNFAGRIGTYKALKRKGA